MARKSVLSCDFCQSPKTVDAEIILPDDWSFFSQHCTENPLGRKLACKVCSQLICGILSSKKEELQDPLLRLGTIQKELEDREDEVKNLEEEIEERDDRIRGYQEEVIQLREKASEEALKTDRVVRAYRTVDDSAISRLILAQEKFQSDVVKAIKKIPVAALPAPARRRKR